MKFTYKTLEEIPEALRSFYKLRDSDSVYVLNCEGAVEATRLAEFRSKNTALKATIETIMAEVTGKPADEFRDMPDTELVTTAKASIKTVKDSANAKTKDEIEKVVTERTAAMKTDLETKLAKALQEKEKFHGEVATLKIDNEAVRLGAEIGLRKTAAPDLIARARGVWKMNAEGKTVAVGPDGKELYGKNTEPLTMKEWIEAQVKDAAHLFEESTGGGGNGGGGGSTGGGGNPFAPGATFNITRQMEIARTNPQEAQRLEAAAGAAK